MFGLFGKNRSAECPIDEEMRQWIENAILWLTEEFGGDEALRSRVVLIPDYKDFPINFDGDIEAAEDALEIIAEQMEIDPEEISLHTYSEAVWEIDTGGPIGSDRVFLKSSESEDYSGGHYLGRNKEGKYQVGLTEKSIRDPLEAIATLAHECAHIKLLGEDRMKENNEQATDLTTIVFGLGVFGANAAFQFRSGTYSWGWSKAGYLTQMEWGYSLALFAFLRGEENPDWVNYLSKNIKSDFEQSTNFIHANKGKIFEKNNDATGAT